MSRTRNDRSLSPVRQKDEDHKPPLPPPLPPGMSYIKNFLADTESQQLITWIDQQPWSTVLSRRVQEYGYSYHTTGGKGRGSCVQPIPKELQVLCDRLVEEKHVSKRPDQVIINEYNSGEGIGKHTDDTSYFDDTVVSISLLSPIIMEFEKKETKQYISMLLEPNSCLVLSGESRYQWTHEIIKRKSDSFEGKKIVRERRVSITLRKML